MLDLALILSPFVSRAGVRGGARFLSSFSRPRFSGERAPGGTWGRFLFVRIPAFRRASSFPCPR